MKEKNRQILNRILLLEILGFLVIVAALWLDEGFDLANRIFGQPKVPFNVVEAVVESALVLLLGLGITLYQMRLFRRIRYLEGFVVLCAFCKKVRVDGEWIAVEEFLKRNSEADFSHSFCEVCSAKHYGHLVKGEVK